MKGRETASMRPAIATAAGAAALLFGAWQSLAQGIPAGMPAPGSAAIAAGTPTASPAAISAVVRVGMTVSDLDRAVDFYTRVLNFRKVWETEADGAPLEQLKGVFGLRVRVARLRLGDEELELTQYLAPRGRPVPVDSRSQDRWFQHVAIIVADMARAYAVLRASRVEFASSGPQRLPDWNPNAGGIEAFYFRDPDGHTLEILHFPPGKGAAKWHGPGGRLFLGIDHTAIVVGDTDRSLAFYRDLLGLTVAGTSDNYGTEQEHLNNVFGAHLRITSLRPAAGPAIELLEYLSPRDGRPYPADERANDLVHWETTVAVPDAAAVAGALRRYPIAFVSPGPIRQAAGAFGFTTAFEIRDPDGHVLEVTQP